MGGFWATSSAPSRILQFEPDFGDGSVIKFNMYDEKSAEKMTMKIDKLLKSKKISLTQNKPPNDIKIF